MLSEPRTRRLVTLALALVAALIVVAAAGGGIADETALAEKYAPIVRLVEQPVECGPGEPYVPMDVDALFGQSTVALRGPWNRTDLVMIGPTAEDLAGLYEYHLDFPGDPLDPGCGYEKWSRQVMAGKKPTMYAHVAADPAYPGQLALQYWLFYAFNDFNNLHEGDWEMIQLDFRARDAAAALATSPEQVGYSSHEGAERASWGDGKLEIVDGTHPVVYPAAGSHANKYTQALYVGSSADAGVGCDNTTGAHLELHPTVRTISSDPAAAGKQFPWITFDGRWGELQPAFFNGPTGPNLKTQWTQPIEWSQSWRSRSYAVPTGGVLGTGATDFFCTAVEKGSRALVSLLRDPGPTILFLGGLIAILVYAGTRTTWHPVAPLRLARRRAWGQTLRAAGRMYRTRARLFLGIGVILIPLGAVISVAQALVLGGFGLLGIDTTGASAGGLVIVVLAVGTTFALLGFALVQAATTCALVEIDAGRAIGPWQAYRLSLRRAGTLVGGLAVAVAVSTALWLTWFLIPVAIWLAVRWALLAQVVEVEDRSAIGSLRRSAGLVRHRWLHVASLVGVGGALALLVGPFVGALLILVTDAPLPLLNLVAGVVYALAMPFVALTTSYVYFDARARQELPDELEPDVLPAEIELST
jgi:hypothetical protein